MAMFTCVLSPLLHARKCISALVDQKNTASKERSALSSIMLVFTCTLAVVLNTGTLSATAISLPRIGQDFNVSEDKLQWAVSAYTLSSGCMLVFLGRLADIHGRKKVFMAGALWLCIFSVGSGFSQNMIMLDIMRGIQGIGAAAMVPASFGILARSFPDTRTRSIAFAAFATGAPIGGAVGCQIGGILTQWTPQAWRSPYFLLAGLAFLAAVGGMFFISNDDEFCVKDKRVDWIGAFLVTSSLTLITFVLGDAEVAPQRWRTPYILAMLILGVLLLFAFLVWEYKLENDPTDKLYPPLVKLSMWSHADGKFAATMAIGFLEWSSFMSWQFWTVLYYQDYEGLDPVGACTRLLPMFVVGILATAAVAVVIVRVPVVIMLCFGLICTGLAGLLFAVIVPQATYWAFEFPATALSVLGVDFVFTCGSIFIEAISAEDEKSLAGGMYQTLNQLGSSLGLATTTIVHNVVLRRAGPEPDRNAQLRAYQAAQWMAFAYGAVGAVIALIFFRNVGIVGQQYASEPSAKDPETGEGGNREKKELL